MFWDEVAALNGFGEETVLQIGQVIQVPVIEEEVVPEATLLVDARRNEVGPVPAEQSPTNLANYTMMAFDPTAKNANAQSPESMETSTGIGGPVSQAAQVALAEGAGGGATSAVLAAHEAETPIESTTLETSVEVGVNPVAEVASASVVSSDEEAPTLYEVQAGDTIISIAVDHDLEWGPLLPSTA